MSAIAIVPPPTHSLYHIQEEISALLDTADLVPPEQEREFLETLNSYLTARDEKTDHIAHYLTHLEGQAALAAVEIKRLQERKAYFEAAGEKLENYVIRVIESLGLDSRGKPKRLDGRTSTMSVRACPASVEVTDADSVTADYKTVTLTLPARTWESLVDGLDLDAAAALLDQIKRPSVAVSKSAVKSAIEGGAEIAGAKLITDKKYLKRS